MANKLFCLQRLRLSMQTINLKQLAGFWSADGVGACSERSSGFPRFFRFFSQ